MQKRRKKLGEILVAQGLITNEQLMRGLQEHKSSNMSLGSVLIKLGYISEEDLSSVLGKQIELDQRKRLGEILVDQGLISPQQLQHGLDEQKRSREQLGRCLVGLGYISESKLIDVLGAQLDIQHVVLDSFSFSPKLLNRLPEEMARKYRVIPLFEKSGIVTVAMADPTNLRTIDHLKFKMGCEIEPVIASERSILNAIDQNYSNRIEKITNLLSSAESAELEVVHEQDEIEEGSGISDDDGAQVIKIVNLIVTQAVNELASDIHIEPMERAVRLRYRVDGELVERNRIPLQLSPQIVSRLKIMAGMDIAEKRKPHCGQFQIRH